MSEYIGMTIEIGGNLKAKYIPDFLEAINTDVVDYTGIESNIKAIHAASGTKLKIYGSSNYGECETLKTFCRKHKLSYIHSCEAKYEYDGEICYWEPGKRNEYRTNATQSGDELVSLETIKPFIDLMLDYIKHKEAAFPLYIGNEIFESIISSALKNPKNFSKALEKKLKQILPQFPVIPDFTIEE